MMDKIRKMDGQSGASPMKSYWVPGKESTEIGKEELNKYIIVGYFPWAEGKHKSTYEKCWHSAGTGKENKSIGLNICMKFWYMKAKDLTILRKETRLE